MNPDYKDIDTVPINILLRDQIGKSLKTTEIEKTDAIIDELIDSKKEYEKKIDDLAHRWVYNLDNSASIGGMYLRDLVKRKIAEKSES